MLCLFVSGAVQAVYGHPDTRAPEKRGENTWIIDGNKAASAVVVAAGYLFVATFATTWGPSSWCYPAEIFPSKVRTKAVSLATASNWLANAALGFAVPPLLHHINWKMYMIFAAFNGCALIHLYIAAPETKGKLLEEMDDVFDSRRKAWQRQPKGSRLDDLAKRIEEGVVKVPGPAYSGQPGLERRTSSTKSLRGREEVRFPSSKKWLKLSEANEGQWSSNTWSDRPASSSKDRSRDAATDAFAVSHNDREFRRVKGQGDDGIEVKVEVQVVSSEPREGRGRDKSQRSRRSPSSAGESLM